MSDAAEFETAMAAIIAKYGTRDNEALHGEIDDLCWQTLRDLGFGSGIDLLRDVELWYA